MRRARSARRTRESPPAPTLHGAHIGSHVKHTSSMWSWGTAHRRPDTPCSSRRSLSSSRRGLIALASGGRSSPVMTGAPPVAGAARSPPTFRTTLKPRSSPQHRRQDRRFRCGRGLLTCGSGRHRRVRRPQSQFRGLPKPAVGGALANVEGGRDSSRGVLLPGWQEVLTRLHQQLCTLAPGHVPTGLKEKLGVLRVQVEAEGADRSALRGVVAAAEAESVRTCEFCGAPGGVRTARTSREAGARPCATPATVRGPPTTSGSFTVLCMIDADEAGVVPHALPLPRRAPGLPES